MPARSTSASVKRVDLPVTLPVVFTVFAGRFTVVCADRTDGFADLRLETGVRFGAETVCAWAATRRAAWASGACKSSARENTAITAPERRLLDE